MRVSVLRLCLSGKRIRVYGLAWHFGRRKGIIGSKRLGSWEVEEVLIIKANALCTAR